MATIIPLADMRAEPRSDAFATFARDAALAPAVPGPVADTRGRALSDLRISVTDRCNFRCVYCMPKDVFGADYPYLPHTDLLTFEEITRVARVFVGMGVRKIRLTGGEPLLRRKVERLVEMLRGLGDVDLTLTTNGALLAKKAKDLRAAGLSRVTVSLDSLDDATFRAMNDVDFPVAKVLEGIDAAAAAGLAPIKINMVVKRGMNEDSIVPMARRFKGSGHIVRFIEYMDVGATNGWRMDDVVSAREIVDAIGAQMPLVQCDPNYRGEVAERWRYADGGGESRRHRVGDAGVLPRLHACAPVDGRQALHVPLRERRLRPARARPRRLRRRGARPRRGGDLAAARRPLFRDPHGEHAARAEGRDELHRRVIRSLHGHETLNHEEHEAHEERR